MSDARFAVFRPSEFLPNRYHNGDTWAFQIDCGYDLHFRTSIRIIGYDAPERNQPLGPAATLYARTKLLAAHDIAIRTIEKMSASRWLAYLQVNGVDFAVTLQHAKDLNYDLTLLES